MPISVCRTLARWPSGPGPGGGELFVYRKISKPTRASTNLNLDKKIRFSYPSVLILISSSGSIICPYIHLLYFQSTTSAIPVQLTVYIYIKYYTMYIYIIYCTMYSLHNLLYFQSTTSAIPVQFTVYIYIKYYTMYIYIIYCTMYSLHNLL